VSIARNFLCILQLFHSALPCALRLRMPDAPINQSMQHAVNQWRFIRHERTITDRQLSWGVPRGKERSAMSSDMAVTVWNHKSTRPSMLNDLCCSVRGSMGRPSCSVNGYAIGKHIKSAGNSRNGSENIRSTYRACWKTLEMAITCRHDSDRSALIISTILR